MKTKSILIALLVLMFTPVQAQINHFSLNSEDGNVVWKIFPQAETPMSGEKLSSGNTVKNAVTGIVPGTVFASYVRAGKEPCPEYGDNIYKVDEALYNRPFWYITSFRLPESLRQVSMCGSALRTPTSLLISGLTVISCRARSHQ